MIYNVFGGTLNLAQSITSGLGSGNFRRISQHCKIGHFSTVWFIFLEKLIESSRKFFVAVTE